MIESGSTDLIESLSESETLVFRWADPADSGPDVLWEVHRAYPPAETLRGGAVQGSHRQVCQGT
jgi:hypothetical protein